MGKFGAIKNVRQEPNSASRTEEPAAEQDFIVAKPLLVPTKIRPTGKRSNPEFEPTTVFLRKSTKKLANRTLEDQGIRKDLSDLIDELLQVWTSEQV